MTKLNKVYLAIGAVLASCCSGQLLAEQMENEAYRVRVNRNGSVDVSRKDVPTARRFSPAFTILFRPQDPGYELTPEREIAYRIPTWKAAEGETNKTRDLFEAAERIQVTAVSHKYARGKLLWHFAEHPQFNLSAEMHLGPGKQEPGVTYRFTPKTGGWYSVGFSGAPEVDPPALRSLWQPLVWQERRFPARSWFSIESMCSLPAVLGEPEGGTFGVVADPAEIPFRLATHHNPLFGVLLRNPSGQAQPMIFAPVLGVGKSRMEPGVAFTFSLRIVQHPGDAVETFEHLARGLYRFRDYRENGSCSLNETLENMIDYAMNDQFSGWVADLRGSDYATDVPGTVKNVSALHPLSIALVTDNEEIYRRRAVPMTEYLLSRQKYLFATRENIKGQSASYLMKGPSAEVSELAALFSMFRGRSEVFRHYAFDLHGKPRALNLDMVSEGESWQNSLALYRLSGDRDYLQKAVTGADRYIASRIDTPQADFTDVHVETGGQFWTDFAPKWIDLFELYEATGDKRYLKASLHGARLFSTYVWMQPCVPDEEVLVNKGGKAGMFYTRRMSNPQPMRAPEQMVPAWRVSQVGLIPEASTTWAGNPAVLLTHHAPYMLRLGHLAGDSFLRDVGRAAVVGRYANFPGYDINGEYTTVYQRPDYPLRGWDQLTYNNIYYNHIWPMIAMCMDYLVSDVVVRSAGNIDFPAQYAQGYAYLQSKVYGDRPGTFFGDKNVRLWLPRKLLRTDSIQANYVAGYGNGSFYLALLNQSKKPLDVKISLNPDVVPVHSGRAYDVQLWRDNRAARSARMKAGEMIVPLSAGGITALKVEGLEVTTQFQDRVFDVDAKPASKESFTIQDTGFGKVTSMLLSISPELTSAYVWLEATPRQVKSAALHYRKGKAMVTNTDAVYPYEFSIPLWNSEESFEAWVEVITAEGPGARTEAIRLKR